MKYATLKLSTLLVLAFTTAAFAEAEYDPEYDIDTKVDVLEDRVYRLEMDVASIKRGKPVVQDAQAAPETPPAGGYQSIPWVAPQQQTGVPYQSDEWYRQNGYQPSRGGDGRLRWSKPIKSQGLGR